MMLRIVGGIEICTHKNKEATPDREANDGGVLEPNPQKGVLKKKVFAAAADLLKLFLKIF